MNLIPYHSEALVSILSKEEVLGHLMRTTRQVNFLGMENSIDEKIKFNGIVGQEGFRISRVIKKGDSFLPLISGKVEATSRGSLILVEYRPFPATVFFLAFWSVILLAFSAYFFYQLNPGYALICLSLALGNYGLGLLFFHRQVRISRALFHEQINLEMKDKD